MALGSKIRELRDDMGMSQAQLAAEGGLSQGYLSQLENDEVQNPSASVIFRLAKALHVDPRVLMHAAGYGGSEGENGSPEYEVAVDPDLLRFLARLPREEQAHLLSLLKGMELSGSTNWAPAAASPQTPAGRPQLQETGTHGR